MKDFKIDEKQLREEILTNLFKDAVMNKIKSEVNLAMLNRQAILAGSGNEFAKLTEIQSNVKKELKGYERLIEIVKEKLCE